MIRRVKVILYIHSSIDDKNMCTVSTFTSMQDSEGNYKFNRVYNGKLVPIPRKSSKFKQFTGLNKEVIYDIPVSKRVSIGKYKISKNFKIVYTYW